MLPTDDEHQLVEEIRHGHHDAFTRLVRQTRAALVEYCASIVHPQSLAEDIVQDVYASQWVHRAEWHVHGNLSVYLRRAVWHRALDVVAQERRQQRITLDAPLDASPEESDQRVFSRELEVATLQVVAELPLRCRQVFLLRAVRELTHAETAETLGIAKSTVNYYLVMARKEIFRRIRDRGIDIPRWVKRPESIFLTRTGQPSAPHLGQFARSTRVDVTLHVHADMHDPTVPLGTARVRVRQRR